MTEARIPSTAAGPPTTRAAVFWMGGDARWRPEGIVPLTTAERADVCIVGGGFTGLWAALHIKRLSPTTDVVLVEREYCGAGASGRNGGWVNSWDDTLPRIFKRFGRDAAVWLADASRAAVDDIRDTVRDGSVDCDLALDGGLHVAASPAQLDHVLAAARLAEELDLPGRFRMLDRDEAQAMWRSPSVVGGVILVHAGSVQPALLAQGLRRLAIAAGVRVYEASPMLAVQRSLPALVTTPSGSVRADRVVLAGGSALASVPELRATLFIIPSHVVATAPAPECLDALGWARALPVADGRTAVHYTQRTADDRAVFGRGGGRLGYGGRVIPEHFHDRDEIAEIVADLRALLPSTRDLAIDWRWGGPVERTQHGLPWVGALGPFGNVHYGVGYSGNGVGPSNLIGRTLAAVALERDDDHARSPLVSEPPSYLPPEPFRSLGAAAVREAIERSEAVEDEGRRPDPVSRVVRRGLDFSLPKALAPRPLKRPD